MVDPSPQLPASDRVLTPELSDADYPHLERTRRLEAVRAGMAGVVQSAAMGTGALQVVAIQYFDAGTVAKGLVASCLHAGLLLTPLVAAVVAWTRLPVAKAMAVLLLAGGIGLGVAASADSLGLFLAGILCGMPLYASMAPMVTALWRQNAPDGRRGRYFSQVAWIGVLAGIAGSAATAWWFGDDPSRFRPVLVCLAVACGIAAVSAWCIPSQPLRRAGRNPLACLSLLWKRPLFGYITAAWMLIGFANLATIPLRTDYLADPDTGLGYAAWLVLLFTAVVPDLCALGSMMIWGRLFDRVNFLGLRIAINLCFGASIACFFSPAVELQILGAIGFGLGKGGGQIAWNLWVTKFARPDETADYMSVHTFLTGVRGVLGPQVALWTAVAFTYQHAAWVAVGMIGVSCVMFLCVLGYGRPGAGMPAER